MSTFATNEFEPTSAHLDPLSLEDFGRGRGPQKESSLAKLSLAIAVTGASGAFQVYANQTILGTVLVYGSVIMTTWLLILKSVHGGMRARLAIPLSAFLLSCTLPLLSAYWSDLPFESLISASVVAALAFSGLVIARELSLTTRLRILAATIGFLLAVSMIAVVIDPATAMDYDTRGEAFRGIFTHKNTLGRIAAIEVVLILALLLSSKIRHRILLFLFGAFSGYLLFESGSKTSLVAVVVAVAAMVVITLTPRSHSPRLLVAIIVSTYLSISTAIKVLGPEVAIFLSRDETLTGRMRLWEVTERYAVARPLFGWGFGAIWPKSSSLGQAIRSQLTFNATSAHNGMIDIRLQLGWIGFVGLVAGLSILLYRHVNQAVSLRFAVGPVGFTILIFVMDLTESTLFFNIAWLGMWVLLAPGFQGDRVPACDNEKLLNKTSYPLPPVPRGFGS